MIRLFRRKALEHLPASRVLRLTGRIRVERVTAAFDGQRQFERIANDSGLHPFLFAKAGSLLLFSLARLAVSEDRIPAVFLVETVFFGDPPDEIFDLTRWKLDRGSARVTY